MDGTVSFMEKLKRGNVRGSERNTNKYICIKEERMD
jgi:hypothetical protein